MPYACFCKAQALLENKRKEVNMKKIDLDAIHEIADSASNDLRHIADELETVSADNNEAIVSGVSDLLALLANTVSELADALRG
jgi:hypothetical protein